MTSRLQRSPVTHLSERGGTGSANTDVMELVNRLDKTDRLTDNSSDAERVIAVTDVRKGPFFLRKTFCANNVVEILCLNALYMPYFYMFSFTTKCVTLACFFWLWPMRDRESIKCLQV